LPSSPPQSLSNQPLLRKCIVQSHVFQC
jgi:hypothetical protein